jgi:hypothetical protein
MKRKLHGLKAISLVILICLIISVAAAAKTKALLGSQHKAAGITCAKCHTEKPPKEAAGTAVCLGCHKD